MCQLQSVGLTLKDSWKTTVMSAEHQTALDKKRQYNIDLSVGIVYEGVFSCGQAINHATLSH